jgi:hypothetical protein
MNRAGTQAAHPGPTASCLPPAAHSQHDKRHDHGEHPKDDRQASLDAHMKQPVKFLLLAAGRLSCLFSDVLFFWSMQGVVN